MKLFKKALAVLSSSVILLTSTGCIAKKENQNKLGVPELESITTEVPVMTESPIIEEPTQVIDYDKKITLSFDDNKLLLDDYVTLLNIDKDIIEQKDDCFSLHLSYNQFTNLFKKYNMTYQNICLAYNYKEDFDSLAELCLKNNISEERLKAYNSALLGGRTFDEYFEKSSTIYVPITDDILENICATKDAVNVDIEPSVKHNKMEEISYIHMNEKYYNICKNFLDVYGKILENNYDMISLLMEKHNIDYNTASNINDELVNILSKANYYLIAYDQNNYRECKKLIHEIHAHGCQLTSTFVYSLIKNNTNIDLNEQDDSSIRFHKLYNSLRLFDNIDTYNAVTYIEDYYGAMTGDITWDGCTIDIRTPRINNILDILLSNYTFDYNINGYYCMSSDYDLRFVDVDSKKLTLK